MVARYLADRRYAAIIGLCAAATLLGGGFALARVVDPARGSVVRPVVTPEGPLIVEPTQRPTQLAVVVVHVSGAVLSPGVYELQEGRRVRDAIEAAGGATEQADPNALNLAALLKDGQRIEVPTLVVGRPAASTSATGPKPINLNTASAAELEALPGVGEVIAQRIVTYREQAGSFASVDELRTQKLVNEATFAKLRDLVVAE
jgi:competence protein ComEA